MYSKNFALSNVKTIHINNTTCKMCYYIMKRKEVNNLKYGIYVIITFCDMNSIRNSILILFNK